MRQVTYVMSKDKTAVEIEVREANDRKAVVRYEESDGESAFSVEFGDAFDTSVRVWFDRIDSLGFMDRDGEQVARVRDNPLRAAIRDAMEAAIWQLHTGDVSALCDGKAEWTDRAYINMVVN